MGEIAYKKYFLHLDEEKNKNAGHKAVNDCEIIMSRIGYGHIDIIKSTCTNSVIRNCMNVLQLFKIFSISSNAELIVQHPMHINWGYMKFLRFVKKIKKIKLIFLVHDLEVLRKLLTDAGSIKKDFLLFRIADKMIVHNDKMKQYVMNKHGIEKDRIVVLEIFDYLVNSKDIKKVKESIKEKTEIVIAGNLSRGKSEYIYNISNITSDKIQFNLYGLNFENTILKSNCDYKGAFDADELPIILEGDYGLVWDGVSLDKCTGNTGNYLKFNNPHKVSLYIAAELPIIIWKEAALADFVLKNNIGIAVDSIDMIESILNGISSEKYIQFKKNLHAISEKVKIGYFLNKALSRVDKGQ